MGGGREREELGGNEWSAFGTELAASTLAMFPSASESSVPAVRRLPGQSLREEWARLVDDHLPFYVFGPLVLWSVAFVELLHEWRHLPPMPTFWLCLAIAGTGWAVIGFLRLMPNARKLLRGERGELKMAEVLEELSGEGYRVFHDIVRDGFNIDHVVVGPGGVFAIETKFRSGRGEITFRNGEGLFIDGVLEEKDSLKQARAHAAEMNRLIQEHCGRFEWVRPLVVFVGNWRVRNDWQTTDTRVFTPLQAVRYIAEQQPALMREEIRLIASHLERSAKAA